MCTIFGADKSNLRDAYRLRFADYQSICRLHAHGDGQTARRLTSAITARPDRRRRRRPRTRPAPLAAAVSERACAASPRGRGLRRLSPRSRPVLRSLASSSRLPALRGRAPPARRTALTKAMQAKMEIPIAPESMHNAHGGLPPPECRSSPAAGAPHVTGKDMRPPAPASGSVAMFEKRTYLVRFLAVAETDRRGGGTHQRHPADAHPPKPRRAVPHGPELPMSAPRRRTTHVPGSPSGCTSFTALASWRARHSRRLRRLQSRTQCASTRTRPRDVQVLTV